MDIKKIINYVVIFTVFSDALILKNTHLFEVRASYAILSIFLFIALAFFKKLYFNKLFLMIYIALIFFSLVNILTGNNTLLLFTKQVLGIFSHAFLFYLFIKFNNFDIDNLFKIYLNIAFIVGSFGILQEIAYLSQLDIFFYYRFLFSKTSLPLILYTEPFLRVSSIMPEPTSFCIVMAPAFFISLFSLYRNSFKFIKKLKCVVIAMSYFLSFSISGYIGIFCAIILFLFNDMKKWYIVICFMFLILISAFSCRFISGFFVKIEETYLVLIGQKKMAESNTSTGTFLTNASVVQQVLKKSPIIGHGLGSHPISYNRYGYHYEVPVMNEKDANSLFFRLLSETGLIGLLLFLGFLIKFYIPKKNDPSDFYWVINNGIIISFIIRLIRQGHYFSEGLFFFFWIYYFTKKLLLSTDK